MNKKNYNEALNFWHVMDILNILVVSKVHENVFLLIQRYID